MSYIIRATSAKGQQVYLTARGTWVFPIRIDEAIEYRNKEVADGMALLRQESLRKADVRGVTVEAIPA